MRHDRIAHDFRLLFAFPWYLLRGCLHLNWVFRLVELLPTPRKSVHAFVHLPLICGCWRWVVCYEVLLVAFVSRCEVPSCLIAAYFVVFLAANYAARLLQLCRVLFFYHVLWRSFLRHYPCWERLIIILPAVILQLSITLLVPSFNSCQTQVLFLFVRFEVALRRWGLCLAIFCFLCLIARLYRL